MTPSFVEELVTEVEEEYAFDRVLPLYMFGWSLAGLKHDRGEPDFEQTCRDAYDLFRQKHTGLLLVQVPWPIDVSRATALDPSVEIDLDLDPNGPAVASLQALVHPDELAAV